MRALLAVLLLAAVARADEPARFFIMGDGRLVLVNSHTNAHIDVHYRRADGTYDEAAIAQIRRAFRSEGDTGEGKASLRLIELLSNLQAKTKVRPLILLSGYRPPAYNEALRASGARAAGGSLHTEGLAADIAFPRPMLKDLWLKIRAMDCCGVGYYAKEGFLHVDEGRPRFWEPQTSRVEENLSSGNARLFGRTEFDRYRVGEPLVVSVYAVTVPPVFVASSAKLVSESGDPVQLHLANRTQTEGCVGVPVSGGVLSVKAVDQAHRGRIVFATCTPRVEKTPESLETNLVTVEAR
jgi:uncharacterized protein YcbK (DUF882 family)